MLKTNLQILQTENVNSVIVVALAAMDLIQIVAYHAKDNHFYILHNVWLLVLMDFMLINKIINVNNAHQAAKLVQDPHQIIV